MFARTAIAATLISLTTLAAVPAQAVPGWTPHSGYSHETWRGPSRSHRLSIDETRELLRDAGYHRVRFIADGGSIYQFRAAKGGSVFIVTMDARTGQLISRYRI